MTLVVLIAGAAKAGKDTSAEILQKVAAECGLSCIKVGFADQLKKICQVLIRQFYLTDIPLELFHDAEEKDRVKEDMPRFSGEPFRIRTVLQKVGTEVFRELLYNDVWCEYVFRTYVQEGKHDVVLCPDYRFANELEQFEMVHPTPCIAFRVTRESAPSLSEFNLAHVSEKSAKNLRVHFEMKNDSTIQALETALRAKFEPVFTEKAQKNFQKRG